MKQLLITAGFTIFSTITVMAQDANTRKNNFNLDNGIAIRGYDPVAYFTQNKALKGSKDITTYFEGVTYYFASEKDREEFKKDPAKYEPQYGGWCAYAMGKTGTKVEVDPETFKIVNSKLYLFYNKYFNNTLKSWNKDETDLKSQADLNWQKIFH